ncbi:MAG: hypothetical protein FIA96_01960 [Betaproteobacteria bacterium]|nr:hypothetical protein [Betaproteobacteria bacterium]
MRLRINRSDGKTGIYSQSIDRRAAMMVRRLDPRTLFSSGPIVIGELNPFSVLNPDEICWVEVETELDTPKLPMDNIEMVRRLDGREEYESILARQWPLWRKNAKGAPEDLLEALVELSFRNSASLYLHLTGRVATVSRGGAIFGLPAITASFEPHGTVYINPKCIVRARIYHSQDRVNYPDGIWVASADDI